MTPENQKRYDEKVNRIFTTISLSEPDRVPINVGGNTFAVTEAGYTVAECIYDPTLEKAGQAVKQYLLKYDNDMAFAPVGYAGEGPIMELLDPTFMMWAGMPGDKVDQNSIQQFIEFPVLTDEDMDLFYADRTGWILHKSMPSISNTLKPLANVDLPMSHRGLRQITATLSTPEMQEMMKKLWQANDMYRELGKRTRAVMQEITELGFPSLGGGKACVPFDEYSDTLRGTALSLMDLVECPEYVQRFLDENFEQAMDAIHHMNPDGKKNNKIVHMTLHKGMDGFMSQTQYRKYYWEHLQAIINGIVEIGMIPNVFCEGRYGSRLEFLKEVPRGRVIYAFEQTPMEQAKKVLGDVACITGGFPNYVLDFGTVEQTVEQVKRMIDICAPGGGYIFRTNATLCNAKRENVEAMFETVKEYGKYH